MLVAAVLVALAVVIARFRLPSFGEGSRRAAAAERKHTSPWRHRNLVLGAPRIGDLTDEQASHYLFLQWGEMMVGRFAGSVPRPLRRADLLLPHGRLRAPHPVLRAMGLPGPWPRGACSAQAGGEI